ncbi:hypothetical protein H5410_061016 [Solanum commersonii]|uniref:Uncharacterized protein n=1 Tax=Solanum commersonii TaxID=4109 RepID=A0A9J5W6T7_SOLCO|nr:hypothetical protein H5410_061016 [Solanum commersonii]
MLASELNLLKLKLTVTPFINHKRSIQILHKNQLEIVLTWKYKEMLHGWLAEKRQRENGVFDMD